MAKNGTILSSPLGGLECLECKMRMDFTDITDHLKKSPKCRIFYPKFEKNCQLFSSFKHIIEYNYIVKVTPDINIKIPEKIFCVSCTKIIKAVDFKQHLRCNPGCSMLYSDENAIIIKKVPRKIPCINCRNSMGAPEFKRHLMGDPECAAIYPNITIKTQGNEEIKEINSKHLFNFDQYYKPDRKNN